MSIKNSNRFFQIQIFVIIVASFIGYPAFVWAFKVDPQDVFSVTTPQGKVIECAPYKNKFVSGTRSGKRFTSSQELVARLKLKIKRLTSKSNSTLITKLNRQLKKLKLTTKTNDALCNNVAGDPNAPEASSLSPYSQDLTREDVRYLVEKAGFGMSQKEQYLIDIGLTQGIDALVSEFMKTKTEADDLSTKVEDLLDGQIGQTTTQTPTGQRNALLYRWSHTNNPYAEKFALFLLSIWTAAGDVIADETFRAAFWEYFERLRNSAYAESDMVSLGVEITRDPLMLIYLSNQLNVKGNPNENYARELMELFTLGPEDLDGKPNYSETNTDGSGDIAVAARMLTGWQVKTNYQTNKLEVAYKSFLHEPGPHTMFVGKSYQFSGENDEDLVRGIFAYHPNVSLYYAKEILKEYVTPSPSRALIENFAAVIQSNNFQLRPAMKTLLSSKAFFYSLYRDTVPKNSAEFAVEVIRTFDLADALTLGEAEHKLQDMGFNLNNAPSVFWYPSDSWMGPSVQLERANFIGQLLGDTTAQKNRSPAWNPGTLLPSGTTTVEQVIESAALTLGLGTMNQNQIGSLKNYMNTSRQYDGSTTSAPYDNSNLSSQRAKGLGLYYVLSTLPKFQLK